MSEKLIVTVLGAGASFSCGYPLAKNLFQELERFGANLGENCALIKLATAQVIKKASELGCLTPNDLAFQMLQRRVGGMANYRQAFRTISYARVATDAFFLALEREVIPAQLESYRNYWHEALGPFNDNWLGAFPETRHRLLSFNYDRMPELALRRHFPSAVGDDTARDLWGPQTLNTGLAAYSKYEVKASRFCYLKLHGSIGIETIGENDSDHIFGRYTKHYAQQTRRRWFPSCQANANACVSCGQTANRSSRRRLQFQGICQRNSTCRRKGIRKRRRNSSHWLFVCCTR